MPGNPRVLFYKAIKEKQLADRESVIQVGNTLGGGSSINLMMYTRLQRCDYDSWKVKGWTADELTPFVKKVQANVNPRDNHD
jgi:alcohol oxidase